jgi:two-component system chemotaxis response regulator CheB
VKPGISLRERVDAVVIGASAGGVEALSALLPALPPDSSAAIFIVLHIPRDKPSLLVQIFTNKCALPVREAEDKEPVVPGTVYFAPSNYHLLVDQGPQTALSADDPVHHSRPSIDVLFESAADVYESRLMGIILTGAIHDRGGLTVVQQPETARSPRMAMSALKSGPVDLVLPLERIVELLGTLNS